MTPPEQSESRKEDEGPVVFEVTWDGGLLSGWWRVRRTPQGYVVEEHEVGVISGPWATPEEAISVENLLGVSSAMSSISFEEGVVEDVRSRIRFDSSVEPGYFLSINGETWRPDAKTIRWQRMGNKGFGRADVLERLRTRAEHLQASLASSEASRDAMDEVLDLMIAVRVAITLEEMDAALRGGDPQGAPLGPLAQELLDTIEERGWREDDEP